VELLWGSRLATHPSNTTVTKDARRLSVYTRTDGRKITPSVARTDRPSAACRAATNVHTHTRGASDKKNSHCSERASDSADDVAGTAAAESDCACDASCRAPAAGGAAAVGVPGAMTMRAGRELN